MQYIPIFVFSPDYLRPQRLRLIRSTQPHDVTVAWDTPDTSQIGSWSLVAFIVAWEIQRVGAVKKVKTSPLLSTLVHEYVFHNILPEDSLNITVKGKESSLLEWETQFEKGPSYL